MSILPVKECLERLNIFHSETTIGGHPAVVGYDKQFRWTWFATQLNCFIFSVDVGERTIDVDSFESLLGESFEYAKSNYAGWPRGFQSALGVILLLIGDNISQAARDYCVELRPSKKWAGFSIPLAKSTSDGESYIFKQKPVWGRVYYGYFEQISHEILSAH